MNELEQWKTSLKIKGRSVNTIKNYYSDLLIFINWLKKQKEVNALTLEILGDLKLKDFESYMGYLMEGREKKNVESSITRRINALRNFFKYLENHELISSLKEIKKVETPKLDQRLPKFLSKEEVKQLIIVSADGCDAIRNKAILMLFLNTGMRKSELRNLNISDIQGDKIRVIGKGNKERVICINQNTISAINDWLAIRPKIDGEDKDALFVSEQKNRMSINAIGEVVKKNLKKINKGDYSTHKLRHTTATLMLQNGQDSRTVQEVLGHENANTTAIYTHVLEEQKRLAANSIELV